MRVQKEIIFNDHWLINFTTVILFTFLSTSINGQVNCSATNSSGSGYSVFEEAEFGIESPDCEHTSFGSHVTQEYDSNLDRNVFVFHSHIVDDNDRCQIQDRVRMEVKGGPGTSLEMQHTENSTSYYRWKFFLDADFVGASSFNHIFQNKAKDGNDDSFPVLTFTARENVLEISHNGGDTGADLGVLAAVDLALIKGKWVEAYLRQLHAENGQLEVSIKDMATGLTLLEYSNNDIDLWRTGATYNRPKWGMYRLKNSTLKDEKILFNDFCISETDSLLCPGEAILIPDTIAPTAPTNLIATAVSMTSVDLQWTASDDAFGVSEYEILQDGIVVFSTPSIFASIDNLFSGTDYSFTVQAKDSAGNISTLSNIIVVTTDAADVLPIPASDPFPADESIDLSTSLTMSWVPGSNTVSFNIYYGEEENPPFITNQIENVYQPILEEFTTYYWKIESVNINGVVTSDIWSFTTGSSNADFPWLVYRANERPELETNFLELNEAPMVPPYDQIVNDPNGSSNTFFGFRSNSDEEFRWRHELAPTDSIITIVARIQAIDPAVNGICYFEVRGNGWRQKVRINQSSIKLEKATPTVEVDLPFDLTNEMHLFRMVSNGEHTTIYLDEDPIPFATAESDTPSSNSYFEWGKSGGSDYGAFIDWLTIDKTGGFSPSEGAVLPNDLFLSSIATLSSVEIDGIPLAGFSSNVLNYTVELDNSNVPSLTWTKSSDLAVVEVSNPASVPNTQAVIKVTAQDGFTVNEYKINYNALTRVENHSENGGISLYPNPANEFLTVKVDFNVKGVGAIYSSVGKKILGDIYIDGETEINVTNIPAGGYIFSFKGNDNTVFNQFFKIK